MVGKAIGCWRIVRALGSGGAGEVYEAEHASFGTRAAIKIFTGGEDHAGLRERFSQEAKLLVQLDHPRIVRVREFGVEEATGRPYFVMDLVLPPNGGPLNGPLNLAAAQEAGMVDEEAVGRWYDDVRAGLKYIHGKKIIHRDLKLQNVLVGADRHAVIADFGVAKIFDAKLRERVNSVDLTVTRVREGEAPVMGTVGYLPPEALLGTAPSQATDYYALGVMIFHLLTGLWCDTRTDLAQALDGYDDVWRKILTQLLHTHPEARACPDRAELVAQARNVEQRMAEEELHRVRRRMAICRLATAGCLVACCLSVGRWWFGHEKRPGVNFEEVMPPVPPEVAETYEGADLDYLGDLFKVVYPTLRDYRLGNVTQTGAAERLRQLAEKDDQDENFVPGLCQMATNILKGVRHE